MKNTSFYFVIISLCLITACQDVVFLPVQGLIEGVVIDNNGIPLSGVQVVAQFEAPSQGGQAQPATKNVTTTESGHYLLTDLWDDVTLSVNHPGFQPVSTLVTLGHRNKKITRDIVLQGSPTISGIALSKNTLTTSRTDTLRVRMEVQDNFNSLSQGYLSTLQLQRADGSTAFIQDVLLESQGLNTYLFSTLLTSDLLATGNYRVEAFVKDPDGNTHQQSAGDITVN